MFTLKGYIINTKEQALSLLMLAKLQDNKRIEEQIMAILHKLP